MTKSHQRFFLLPGLLVFGIALIAQPVINVAAKDLVFSAIKGTSSKPDTILLTRPCNRFSWLSGDSAAFTVTPLTGRQWMVWFKPSAGFTGIARAVLQFCAGTKTLAEYRLAGLSTNGLEGENEPPLSTLVAALGYQVNIGWTSLANHSRPELQGDELGTALFKKAGKGKVTMLPVARYSPDFELPFGFYYYYDAGAPVKQQAGILAKAGKYPEHQGIFPALATGSAEFDPGNKRFGFYATGPSHTAYSEDVWNMLLHPENAVRAVRIYPLKNKAGVQLKYTYLVCFEEAKNGDYNDYVFLVKNVVPVNNPVLKQLFNGKDLHGWHTFIKGKGSNVDPDNNFRVEDSALHVIGKDLGYIITDSAYHNYHLRVSFKWGDKKWPPRENAKRDAGICYNIPVSEPDSIWPVSIECQIQEGDVGDFWLLGFSTINVDGTTNRPSSHTQMAKKKNGEKPNGEWNTVEVISFNGTCVHIVNGLVVNYGTNASVKDGRILLQSEYSEVFYRDVSIRKL